MIIKKRVTYFIISFVSFLLFFIFYFFTFKPSLPLLKNLPISEEKTYVIKPILPSRIWENPELYLPRVTTSPNDKKYWLIQLREKIDLKMHNFDELFFAEKHLAELEKWGNTLNQVQWKENLVLYNKMMQKYLHSKLLNLSGDQRSDQVIFLYQELSSHESKLRESVDNALFPLDTQKKLINKIFNIIDSLKLSLVNNQENNDLKYSLAPIIKDKEFGTYSIDDDHQIIEITPDNLVKTYSIKYPFTPQEFKFITTLESDPKNFFNRYLFWSNYILKPETTYLARISFYGEHPINIIFNQKINATESAQLINQTLYPYEKITTKTITFTTPKSKKPLTYWPNIIIESKYPIPWSRLDSFGIVIQPVFDKELTLTKINVPINYQPQIKVKRIGQNQYQIYYKNTTLEQDNFIKASLGFIWKIQEDSENSFTVSIRFLPLLAYISILSFFIFIFFDFIRSLISFLINITLKISQFFRFPILIISLVLIFIDIFFIPKSSDVFILLAMFFWTLFIIGFRVEARISFLFALVYLLVCPVFLLLQKEAIAEKSAIWAYMMLVAGTFQSIIEIRLNLKNLRSPKQVFEIILENPFVAILVNYLLIIKSIIAWIGKKLFNFVSKISYKIYLFLDYLINFKPADFSQLIFSLLKGFVLIILLMYSGKVIFKKVSIVYVEYRKKVIAENRRKLYESRRPKIKLVEPTLVYKATKIVLYGKDFGWDVKKARALIDGKEIDAVLWTDSKIIFPVPLDWRDGSHKIWIEKQINWDGKKQEAKSEVFEIKILPITGSFTEDDKLYFEQMKTWKPETRKLNGYE